MEPLPAVPATRDALTQANVQSVLPQSWIGQRPQAAPGHVERPNGSRPPSARPHVCRFVEQTLGRLNDDEHRHAAKSGYSTRQPVLRASFESMRTSDDKVDGIRGRPATGDLGSTGSTVPTSRCSPIPLNSVSDDTAHGAYLEHWRDMFQIFHEETRDCVRVLRSCVEGANIRCCAREFEDWRKFDQQMTAQMQRHLEELVGVHQALRKFQYDYLTTDEFGHFRKAMDELQSSVEQLEKGRVHHFQLFQGVAASCADNAASRVSSDWCKVSEPWEPYIREQRERWSGDDERWARFEAHFEQLNGRLDRLHEATSRLDLERSLESVPSLVAERVDPLLREAMRDINGANQRIVRHATDDLQNYVVENLSSLTKTLSIYFEDNSRIVKPIEQSFKGLDARLDHITDAMRQEAELQRQADAFREDIKQLRGQLEASQEETSASRTMNGRLQDECTALEKAVDLIRGELINAQHAIGGQALRHLKAVESRGNVRLNIASGIIDFIRHLVFSPGKPSSGQASGEWKSPEEAQPVLQDLAELVGLFSVPVVLEASTKAPKPDRSKADVGNPAFWEQVAVARAELLREELVKHGVERELIVPKGVFKKSANSDTLVVRFDSVELFAGQKAPQKDGKGRAGRGRSPDRSRSP